MRQNFSRREAPRQAKKVSEAETQSCAGRLPNEIIDFWRQNGVGHYVGRNYWLCTPMLFDGLLDNVLAGVLGLGPSELAAFGYSSLGVIDLWHREGRHFTFSPGMGLLMDLTSRTQSEPVPHDLADLYTSAGLEMPEDAVERFLQSRSRPEDIWMILLTATSADSYRMTFDDNGKALIPLLRRTLGELGDGEVYFRSKDAANIVGNYEKLTIAATIARVPTQIVYSFATEVAGSQIVKQTTKTRSS